ncbi:MAG: hypothetical protein CMJ20_09280 [Phycisphaeraceae bacterium]|nr:hypothetical protein [Phycisphaeraceae bacterium]|tara:strand:- start:170 stop:3043 length:2874 start_codon:yes stop_codon:yes gene_type:complete
MAIERVFLGWHAVALELATEWLWTRYRNGQSWDMGQVMVTVPGRRAGRRLLENFLKRVQQPIQLVPPQIVTAGELPVHLCQPPVVLATPIQSLLARIHVLQSLPSQQIKSLVTTVPNATDPGHWIAIAQQIETLIEKLAADTLCIYDLPVDLRKLPTTDQSRWMAMAEVQQRYERLLAKTGLTDRNQFILNAIKTKRCQCDQELILLATTDLNRATRQIIAQLHSPVAALIHAPTKEADRFDELGCIQVEAWIHKNINLQDSHIHFVNRPQDQTMQVLESLRRITTNNKTSGSQNYRPSVDQVTIGLGDPMAAPSIRFALETMNITVRQAVPETVRHSRPVQLLNILSQYVASQRFADLASLLRHPDLESYLEIHLEPGDHLPTAPNPISRSLALLDKYAAKHLPFGSTDAFPHHDTKASPKNWLGHADTAKQLAAICNAIGTLLPDGPQEQRPLSYWSEQIGQMLKKIYHAQSLDHTNPNDARLLQTLQVLSEALQEQIHLGKTQHLCLNLSLPATIEFTLSRVYRKPIADENVGPAVEMLGWLELHLDDAPHLVVTNFNEGCISNSDDNDSLLSDAICHKLGITDSRRRLARDLMMLQAIIHSRQSVTLIAPRRDPEDNPLAPSRLLLACSHQELPQRISQFYQPTPDTTSSANLFPLQPGHNRFAIPKPSTHSLDCLPVTAFRDYLQCPYRFYLKHVCGLTTVNDQEVELNASAFGNLLHETLSRFGKSTLATSQDPKAIFSYLKTQLENIIKQRYGLRPTVAIRIQRYQLLARLEFFSNWQASHAADGWAIVPELIEKTFQATINIDQEPFTITGRIDRIDRHPDGRYRVIDYKTSNTPKHPKATHQQKSEWIDLQLPLYQRLLPSAGICETPQLGYIQLPKDQGHTGYQPADWSQDQIDSAWQEAKKIIRLIRTGHFWPPGEPITFDDGFSYICMDNYPDRTRIIATTEPAS